MLKKLIHYTIPVVTSAVIIVALGCDESLVGPSEDSFVVEDAGMKKTSHITKQGPGAVTLLTRNVYVGGNVDLVLMAGPEDVPLVVAQVFQTVVSTNFAERAAAFAKEIAANRPHLVGLQEISLIRVQSPGDLIVGGTTPAETVFQNQLNMLMAALSAAGLDYYVAGSVENLDVEVPMLTGVSPLTFDDVRLTDFDVLLARGDVATTNVVGNTYSVGLPVPGLGTITRGYVMADATIRGRMYRVATTHLEAISDPAIIPLQQAQAFELISTLASSDHPVFVMGDLNTGPGDPSYQMFEAAGYIDLWKRNLTPHAGPGFTCCFPDDLVGTSRLPDLRYDIVLFRSPNTQHGNDGLGAVFADVLGDTSEDLTPGGLWPSDHAGFVATVRAPNLGTN